VPDEPVGVGELVPDPAEPEDGGDAGELAGGELGALSDFPSWAGGLSLFE